MNLDASSFLNHKYGYEDGYHRTPPITIPMYMQEQYAEMLVILRLRVVSLSPFVVILKIS
jgi:hypothetical protein